MPSTTDLLRYPRPRAPRFHPFVPIPGRPSFGAWRAEGPVAVLKPTEAPWRSLLTTLDAAATESDAPVSALDEAEALVAVGWRYGSYAHVLTGGQAFGPLRRGDLSRATDGEMYRMNLEFSSAVARWLEDRAADPHRIARRVRAARRLLPMPWAWHARYDRQTGAEVTREELLAAIGRDAAHEAEGIARVRALLDDEPVPERLAASPVRAEANFLVNRAYRDGEIENLHAGEDHAALDVPGFLRLYPDEVARVTEETSGRIAHHLLLRERVEPELLRRYMAVYPFSTSHRSWSLTDETRAVRYAGLPDAPPAADRLRELAVRFPEIFGG